MNCQHKHMNSHQNCHQKINKISCKIIPHSKQPPPMMKTLMLTLMLMKILKKTLLKTPLEQEEQPVKTQFISHQASIEASAKCFSNIGVDLDKVEKEEADADSSTLLYAPIFMTTVSVIHMDVMERNVQTFTQKPALIHYCSKNVQTKTVHSSMLKARSE